MRDQVIPERENTSESSEAWGRRLAWSEGLRDPGQTQVAGIPRGHQVVLAGPGTGKTFVLVRRVENLVEVHGLNPSRIACLTFTRAAAAEMRERLDARLGDVGRRVRVSTLHSFALRELLRSGASDIPDPVRVVGDWEERWVVVKELARILNRKVGEYGMIEALERSTFSLTTGRAWLQTIPGGRQVIRTQRSSERGGGIVRSTGTVFVQSLSTSFFANCA
jgi:hypothetical protein